jgi:NAD(P)-dependent dehydrogenase (short-subunit alcohol dehydrogenase family)
MKASQVARRNEVVPSGSKTVVITGASSGIGLSAALALAKAGWRVICAVRSVEKMNKLIATQGEIGPGTLECMELDLANFESVRTFASDFLARSDISKLDALLLNAGIGMQWGLTKDGYEQGFQTCHLSHHLLVRLLEAKLIESAPSRVVVVASHAHKAASKTYDWPQEGHKGFRSDSAKAFSVPFQYAQSKVANMHFALVLSKRFEGKGVAVLTEHPGVINSNLWPKWMIGRSLYMLTVEQGAATSAFLVSDPQFDAKDYVGYTYWSPSRFGLPHQELPNAFARDELVAQQLWEVTEKIVAPFLHGKN